MHTNPNQSLFSYETAARYLGVSIPTLKRWKAAGIIGHVKLGPRKVYFTQAQLDAVTQTVEPTGVAS